MQNTIYEYGPPIFDLTHCHERLHPRLDQGSLKNTAISLLIDQMKLKQASENYSFKQVLYYIFPVQHYHYAIPYHTVCP